MTTVVVFAGGGSDMGMDAFSYAGKRALVVGGATGMGAAAATIAGDLGAEVIVMDYADVTFPCAQAIKVDLNDVASCDAALAQVDGPVHAVFSAAGIAGGPGVMKVNFIAHRHILESLVESGKLTSGSAVCFISSVAGLGWENQLPTLLEFLETSDFASMWAWVEAHEGTDNYGFAKQAMNAYVAQQAYPLLAKGIRINSILPGPTDTPLARANADTWLTFASDYRDATGAKTLTPEEMAYPMIFLNSAAASGVSGVTMLVDQGHVSSSLTGSWNEPIVKMLVGRS